VDDQITLSTAEACVMSAETSLALQAVTRIEAADDQ